MCPGHLIGGQLCFAQQVGVARVEQRHQAQPPGHPARLVTGDRRVERDQYLLGPEFAIGKVSDWGTYGVWLKHWVDVADVSGRDVKWSTNESYLKFFFAYGLGNGWNIIANPEIEYDWEGAGSNKLYLPIGGGISKTTELWRVPVKMDLELYNYIESPDAFGPEWMLTFAITPVWQR